MSDKLADVKRAAKILELQEQITAGKRAQTEYNEVHDKLNRLNSYISTNRFYEEPSEIHFAEDEIENLKPQLAKLSLIIKQAARAEKSLKRMQHNDAMKRAAQSRTDEVALRAKEIEQLLQARRVIEDRLEVIDRNIDNADLNMDNDDYSDMQHSDSMHDLIEYESQRQDLQSQLDSINRELLLLQNSR